MNRKFYMAVMIGMICLVTCSMTKPTAPIEETYSSVYSGQDQEDLMRYLRYRERLRLLNEQIKQEALKRARESPSEEQNYRSSSDRSDLECRINMGLSYKCDFRDAVASYNDQLYWSSNLSPGKRRK